MTRVIAVTNQKGGVGKTTTAVNLAACLAEAEFDVLLLDMDPQANASSGLGVRPGDPRLTSYGVLGGAAGIAEATVTTVLRHLSIVPACPDLAGAVVELANADGNEFVLEYALAGHVETYDFVFIDCPPSLGVLTVNSLVAAQEVLVPVQAEYYALEGLAALLETIGLVQEHLNPGLTILGVLVTMYDGRTRLGREVAGEVREHLGEHVFQTIIPRNVRLSEAPSHGLPISRYDATCAGSDAYFDLAKEVVSRE
ncbi:MAG TPA: ParA family protein [Thermoleophilia bacterium]|nr:ParA family protein [Thermoleophilia bacterium]